MFLFDWYYLSSKTNDTNKSSLSIHFLSEIPKFHNGNVLQKMHLIELHFLCKFLRYKEIFNVSNWQSLLYLKHTWWYSSFTRFPVYYTIRFRSEGCGCLWVSTLTKIGANHSAPSSVHPLTHCGSISDWGGVQAPEAVPPVAIRGLFSPHPAHALLTALTPLTLARGRVIFIVLGFLNIQCIVLLEWSGKSYITLRLYITFGI